MCFEFVPAGVSCICHYDDVLPIGPDNLTHTHKAIETYRALRPGYWVSGLMQLLGMLRLIGMRILHGSGVRLYLLLKI